MTKYLKIFKNKEQTAHSQSFNVLKEENESKK